MRLSTQYKLVIGILTMVLGLTFSRFMGFLFMGVPVFSFLSGLFMGISIVLNLSCLLSRKQRLDQKQPL